MPDAAPTPVSPADLEELKAIPVETRADTLESWFRQMWRHARVDLSVARQHCTELAEDRAELREAVASLERDSRILREIKKMLKSWPDDGDSWLKSGNGVRGPVGAAMKLVAEAERRADRLAEAVLHED
jgi:hypothetical protein